MREVIRPPKSLVIVKCCSVVMGCGCVHLGSAARARVLVLPAKATADKPPSLEWGRVAFCLCFPPKNESLNLPIHFRNNLPSPLGEDFTHRGRNSAAKIATRPRLRSGRLILSQKMASIPTNLRNLRMIAWAWLFLEDGDGTCGQTEQKLGKMQRVSKLRWANYVASRNAGWGSEGQKYPNPREAAGGWDPVRVCRPQVLGAAPPPLACTFKSGIAKHPV